MLNAGTPKDMRAATMAEASDHRFREMLDSTDGIVWEADATTFVFSFVSKQAERLLGYPLEDWLRPGFWVEHLHPADREWATQFCIACTGRIEPHDFEYRFLAKDGRTVWLRDMVQVFAEGGKPRWLRGVMVDVSRAKQAEQALRESEERNRQVVDAALDAVVAMDAAGVITAWNPQAEAIFGWTAAEAVGMALVDTIMPPRHREAHQRGLVHYLESGEGSYLNRRLELTAVRRGGEEIPVEVSVAPIVVAGERRFAAFLRDLTERKRAEAERTRLEEQLRHAQKLEAIGRLAGGVAHDFNNLLTVIQGYVACALRDIREGDRLREDLLEVSAASDRAAALTSQLLAFGRKQVLQPTPLDLSKVAAGLERMLRPLIGEDVELRLLLAPGLGRALADKGQLEQVLMNLVINARDAMPAGGRITVETARADVGLELAQQIGVAAGPHVRLSVTDTGSGMDEATRARVFEPYFTTKEHGHGTGLGLSTVYGIIKQSGGGIAIESAPGRGSTFSVYLPLDAAARRESTQPEAAAGAAPAHGSETVLVVEDEAPVRALARRFLSEAGYTVLLAAGPDEALRACGEHRGQIDLLLTDVVMPRMGGSALATELARLRPSLRVLFMSGYTDDAVISRGSVTTGVHFIQKPFGAIALTRKVREVLDGA